MDAIWSKQIRILRRPSEIFGAGFKKAGITDQLLRYQATESFSRIIHELGITLLVSREYENFLIAFSAGKKRLIQTFFHIPHPCGIAVDSSHSKMYVVSTRNPNQLVEFVVQDSYLIPKRVKYYPGSYYFHDIAFIGDTLYANAVGKNGIVKIDINTDANENITWWPNCITGKNGEPRVDKNYIQLNSIAAGKTLAGSFFTASNDSISKTRPGDKKFDVLQKGVIFSGITRDVIARGLTRPHSARLIYDKIFVNNSGFGEFGCIDNGIFRPVLTLSGWTRGLHAVGDIVFIGISRVLWRYRNYAPGLKYQDCICGIIAYSMKKDRVIGSIRFPFGNQIFSIQSISSATTSGFSYKSVRISKEKENSFFYN